MLRAFECAPVGSGQVADLFHCGEVAAHQGEGLLAAALATAEFFYGDGVSRVACQVEPAEAFNGKDLAGGQPAMASSTGAERRGPQAGQALGWAWKRRSPGLSYSAR
jgi:hypothetical protein